jgi:DNA-binding response OmpR family regulator
MRDETSPNELLDRPWVLIAEDDEDISELVRTGLEDYGYRVRTCTRAAEAIQLIEKQNFRCVILDWNLASGTADQVILHTRLKTSAINTKTPIVVMSGNFDPAQLQRIRSHVSAAIAKPFDLQNLLERVKILCPPTKAD